VIFTVGDIEPLVTYDQPYVAHHRVLQFVVNHNVLEFNHAHHASLTSLLNVIAHLKYIFDQFVHVNHALIYAVFIVGNVVSLFIIYALDVAHVHHVSITLILKSVLHSAGVNAGVVNDVHTVSLQLLQPFVEYCTFVIADGHAVLLAVHVIVHA
jgi:hypothetical protein